MIPDYRSIFEALDKREVDFVVIGAVALVLHGSARVTRDLDVCYSRERANLERLARALKPFAPTLRGAPAGLPFTLDVATLRAGLNFTLQSSSGDLDLLGEVTGIGAFAAVKRLSVAMRVYDRDVRVLSLDGLERAKRAAGRLKDLADLAARGESPAAFDRRCIPPAYVAPRSHTAGILPRRALPDGRITGLGATLDFHHGLLEEIQEIRRLETEG